MKKGKAWVLVVGQFYALFVIYINLDGSSERGLGRKTISELGCGGSLERLFPFFHWFRNGGLHRSERRQTLSGDGFEVRPNRQREI